MEEKLLAMKKKILTSELKVPIVFKKNILEENYHPNGLIVALKDNINVTSICFIYSWNINCDEYSRGQMRVSTRMIIIIPTITTTSIY